MRAWIFLPVLRPGSSPRSPLECSHAWPRGWSAAAQSHWPRSPRHSRNHRPGHTGGGWRWSQGTVRTNCTEWHLRPRRHTQRHTIIRYTSIICGVVKPRAHWISPVICTVACSVVPELWCTTYLRFIGCLLLQGEGQSQKLAVKNPKLAVNPCVMSCIWQ